MNKLMTVTGFRRYTPEDAMEGVPYYMDSEGRDWYQLRYEFSPDTMKFIYDEEGRLLSFARSAEFMMPTGTISEMEMKRWPPGVSLNGFWRCGPNSIECRIENLGDRMLALSQFFIDIGAESKSVKLLIEDWQSDPCYPMAPFPRFSGAVVQRAVEKGMDINEYNILTLKETP